MTLPIISLGRRGGLMKMDNRMSYSSGLGWRGEVCLRDAYVSIVVKDSMGWVMTHSFLRHAQTEEAETNWPMILLFSLTQTQSMR